MSVFHVVSVSSGKDSAATAVLALETMPKAALRFVSCDTGNEHESYLPYLAYMERHLRIKIDVLRASFADEIARKRDYVRDHWPRKGVPQADCERAIKALVPTGNPFLDLCVWKGRFPSRTAQFCTQHLKTDLLVGYAMGFIERGECEAVWSWQGTRINESESRRRKLHISGHLHRGFEAHECVGLKPNPLYSQGMTRVGCMPCINAGKDEVLEISKRFPGHIERIEYWEALVAQSSKRLAASFFPDPDRDAHLDKRGIRAVVEWSKTKRGGQLMDWIRINEEPAACSSAYGLCE